MAVNLSEQSLPQLADLFKLCSDFVVNNCVEEAEPQTLINPWDTQVMDLPEMADLLQETLEEILLRVE